MNTNLTVKLLLLLFLLFIRSKSTHLHVCRAADSPDQFENALTRLCRRRAMNHWSIFLSFLLTLLALTFRTCCTQVSAPVFCR